MPLRDLLGARPMEPEEAEAIQVSVDNAASQFFSVVEVRAPDQVGLLYRIARALHELGLDIHHAKIATHPEGALDVFYVWDLSGEKLDAPAASPHRRQPGRPPARRPAPTRLTAPPRLCLPSYPARIVSPATRRPARESVYFSSRGGAIRRAFRWRM